MHGCTAAAARPGIIDIPKAEHTYQPLLLGVDDGKAPHPFALHNASCRFDIVLVETEMDALRHNFPRGGSFWIPTLCNAAADNIAIGHHANQSIILTDGNGADVVHAHQIGELFYACQRINPRDALVHCPSYFHERLLFSADPVVLKLILSNAASPLAFL